MLEKQTGEPFLDISEELSEDLKIFIKTLPEEELARYRQSLASGELKPDNIVILREPRSEKEFKVRACAFSSIEIGAENPYDELSVAGGPPGLANEYLSPESAKPVSHVKGNDLRFSQPPSEPLPPLPQPEPQISLPPLKSEKTTVTLSPVDSYAPYLPIIQTINERDAADCQAKEPKLSHDYKNSSEILSLTTKMVPSPPISLPYGRDSGNITPKVDPASDIQLPASPSRGSKDSFWKKWKQWLIAGCALFVLLIIGIIVVIIVTRKRDDNSIAASVTTTTQQSITQSSNQTFSTQTTMSTTTNSNQPTSDTTSTTSTTTLATSTLASTTNPNTGKINIYNIVKAGPLTHNAPSSASVATVGIDAVLPTLLLTWQDPAANATYVSALDISGNMQDWSSADHTLSIDGEVSQFCGSEHICTILGISSACYPLDSCSRQNLAQYCCTCGSQSSNTGVICSVPLTNSYKYKQRILIGSAWAVPSVSWIYFVASNASPRFLSDYYAMVAGDPFHEGGYSFPDLSSLCSQSCSILSATSAVFVGTSDLLFGAVIQHASDHSFCVFLAPPVPDSPILEVQSCNQLPSQSGSTKIAVAADMQNKVWYISDININANTFIIYSIVSNGEIKASDSTKFDVKGYPTYVGMAFKNNALHIVLQSPTNEHIVTKYMFD